MRRSENLTEEADRLAYMEKEGGETEMKHDRFGGLAVDTKTRTK